MTHTENRKVNCRECIYYYVTWDINCPYGCKAMGFKGKQMPSIAVLNSTGKQCLLFEKKVKTRGDSSKKEKL
ncbi:MAG: uracil-DNA glycosylase [Desulfamplus sp.]|nr:uracil-DNA glycosylase [Desulfamplus sp.]MBF0411803.1 uracil-DNA glycosylase [Desulfamplus sp.]